MGKKKLEISFISDPRRRSSIFFNRRSGLFKKAHDLSKTCGTKVSVILTDLKGNLHLYSNTEHVKLSLKKSILEGTRNKSVQIFRYNELDYPFTNLSHVGRKYDTFTEEDFGGLTMVKTAEKMDGEQNFENFDLGDELLGKRKKLKIMTESLSKALDGKELKQEPSLDCLGTTLNRDKNFGNFGL